MFQFTFNTIWKERELSWLFSRVSMGRACSLEVRDRVERCRTMHKWCMNNPGNYENSGMNSLVFKRYRKLRDNDFRLVMYNIFLDTCVTFLTTIGSSFTLSLASLLSPPPPTLWSLTIVSLNAVSKRLRYCRRVFRADLQWFNMTILRVPLVAGDLIGISKHDSVTTWKCLVLIQTVVIIKGYRVGDVSRTIVVRLFVGLCLWDFRRLDMIIWR